LACVFARDQQGFQTNFPLVETIQQKSKCSIIMGPLKHPAFPRLKKRIQKMLEETNYVGCLGVEMFAVGNELIVNELAPRVHNTAHFSQNALLCSQFDLHIKAVSGFSIKSELLPFENFCMINLLGTGKPFVKIPANHSGALHMYGKSQSMDGRKMGHINFVGKKSLKKLKSLAEAQREKFVL
jgi:5-(carboxyamino)imidazole ribonucleotide synthase